MILDHHTDVHAGVLESEVFAVALVAARCFASTYGISLDVRQQLSTIGAVPQNNRICPK